MARSGNVEGDLGAREGLADRAGNFGVAVFAVFANAFWSTPAAEPRTARVETPAVTEDSATAELSVHDSAEQRVLATARPAPSPA